MKDSGTVGAAVSGRRERASGLHVRPASWVREGAAHAGKLWQITKHVGFSGVWLVEIVKWDEDTEILRSFG